MKRKTKKMIKRVEAVALSMALLVTGVSLDQIQVNASTSSMTADNTKFTNPVINADVPDPDIIRVGDTYYMSSTTMHYSPGVPIMKSKDLVNWEICNYVYDTLCDSDQMNLSNNSGDLTGNKGNAYSKSSWASSLRYFDETYYCSFASYTTGKTYIYKTKDIENGTWEKSEFDGVYHDMSLYFDEETKKGYMIYGGTPIYIVELNEDYTAVLPETKQVLVQDTWPELSEKNFLLGEGSHIQKIDGKFYLFLISWPPTLTTSDGEEVTGGRTQLCYTSDSLMGPYERHIILNDQGAAQGQLIDTPDGEWYGFVFKDSGALGRTPVLVPVTWTTDKAENGIKYPVLGDNKKVNATLDMPVTGETRTTIVDSDEFYNLGSGAAEEENILTNGGFEAGTKGWTGREGATLSLAYSTIVSGTLGLKISERKTTGAGPMQDITGKVKAGDTLAIAAKIQYRYYEGDAASKNYPDTKQFIISIVYGDGTIKNMVSTVATKDGWANLSGTYQIPEDADMSNVTIFIETPWTSTPDISKDLMTFYVDDVSITRKVDSSTTKVGSKLKLEWQWNHNPDNDNWSLTERDGYLRIRNSRIDQSILHTQNTLTQRVFGPQSNAYIKLDTTNMKDGDVAGLAAFQEKYGYIGVKKEGDKTYLVQSNTNSTTGQKIDSWKEETENARLELAQDSVLVRMAFDSTSQWDQKISFYYSIDEGKSWHKFGDTSQITFELSHFVGTRFALFNYATKEKGGYVDFDYFRVASGEVKEGAVVRKNASIEGESFEVDGEKGKEIEVPITMDATDSSCTAIEATFSVPEYMEVTRVTFDKGSVTGDCTYEVTDNSVELRVEGANAKHTGGKFATITLKVSEEVKGEQHVQLITNCIRGIGNNIEYNVEKAVANITIFGKTVSNVLLSGTTKTPTRGNPLMDHKFGADPYAITYNGRVYVYMTNDSQQYDTTEKDENGYPVSENNYSNIATINVISSDDMVNWVDHGSIPVAGRNATKDPNGIAKWANNSWAPAACYKTIDGKDKFFLYFADNANGIGVLEADSPIGPFREPETGSRLIYRGMQAAEGVTWLFDPAVLVDDDGTGYLYYGGGISGNSQEENNYPGTARVVKLKENMVEVEGDAVAIDAPGLFEDSGIHKYNNKYYYTYCSNFSNNLPETGNGNICTMVSDNPMGPFTFVGKVFDNPNAFFGIGGNNHHAFFQFNGVNYLIYHAQTVGKSIGIPSGKQGYRSTHIDSFSYDEEGNIQTITGTWKGTSQLKNVSPFTRVEAETLGWSKGITTGECSETGFYESSLNMKVTEIHKGDYVAVSKADFGDGAQQFTVNAAGLSGGTIAIHLDSEEGQKIGEVTIPAGTGDKFTEYSCEVMTVPGVHDVYFVFDGGRSKLFDLDYWRFTEKEDHLDQEAANLVIKTIDAIGIVAYTDESKAKIDAARTAYALLTDAQKELVTNYVTLTEAEKTYETLKAQAEQKEVDKKAASEVVKAIHSIGKVTYTSSCKAKIDVARTAYALLTDAQKELVTNYVTLTEAEKTYETLKAQAEQKEVDKKAASEVVKAIHSIGKVTYTSSCKAKIDAARTAYNKLTVTQKSLVTNYNTLLAAEKTYAKLKGEADKAQADKVAAEKVIKAINRIGKVTYTNSCKAKIDAARAAYNRLTSTQKKLVTNYKTLTKAEAEYKKLASDKGIEQGKTYKVGNYSYKVTNLKGRTVTIMNASSKSLKTLTVSSTVKIRGISFAVTAINKGAFKNYKTATKIVIGRNVKVIGEGAFENCYNVKSATVSSLLLQTIGRKAFYKCKNLKAVTLKTTVLKSVGKLAFGSTNKKLVISVPTHKKKAYRQLFKNAGLANTEQIS